MIEFNSNPLPSAPLTGGFCLTQWERRVCFFWLYVPATDWSGSWLCLLGSPSSKGSRGFHRSVRSCYIIHNCMSKVEQNIHECRCYQIPSLIAMWLHPQNPTFYWIDISSTVQKPHCLIHCGYDHSRTAKEEILPFLVNIYLGKRQWFSTWDSFATQQTLDNVWDICSCHTSGEGTSYWYLVGKGQGCCQTCCNAQVYPNNKELLCQGRGWGTLE